ncbi:hypothetical protein STEG23_025858, partial [Scotinomys teguina]
IGNQKRIWDLPLTLTSCLSTSGYTKRADIPTLEHEQDWMQQLPEANGVYPESQVPESSCKYQPSRGPHTGTQLNSLQKYYILYAL